MAPGSALVLGIVRYGVLGFGLGTINTLIFALQGRHRRLRQVEERHPGRRRQLLPCVIVSTSMELALGACSGGVAIAVLSFIRKTGQGIGGAVAACIIGLGGYIATAVRRPPGR